MRLPSATGVHKRAPAWNFATQSGRSRELSVIGTSVSIDSSFKNTTRANSARNVAWNCVSRSLVFSFVAGFGTC
jgi:hypothetical protein